MRVNSPVPLLNESVNVHQQKRTTDLVVRFLFVTYGAENPTIGWRSAVACKRLRFSVQRTFCYCERKNGDPKRYFCTFGEKAHTSIRVSIIACNNVISKAQCATHRPEGTPHYKTHARYFRTCVEKKSAHKQKSEHCRPRQCDFKSEMCAANYIKSLFVDTDDNIIFSIILALSAQNNALTRCFVCCGAVCIF